MATVSNNRDAQSDCTLKRASSRGWWHSHEVRWTWHAPSSSKRVFKECTQHRGLTLLYI
ncbi:hypothetical protein PISMIDRAFT_680498 [Pisolithus microcarpus 441]|uniref:Uncharacterized protein n=1 Tax=Pisolithus microcarpus 441 TaxID=765257 RepID=A0A0C9ZI56_9AGAM|nr:hypothetical protein PISMIDRAFT_690627 [Pisolithus microcarpus 441]KIK22187.1 hypothetical protein PISMIDRAFT_680498 [Pisolithus microcarpus 441]